MVVVSRYRSLLWVVLTATGCTGYIELGGGLADLPPDQAAAQTLWEQSALPVLRTGTTPPCIGCHDGVTPQPAPNMGPAYLMGGDDLSIRQTLLKFTPMLLSFTTPSDSLLVTKQSHEGPQMDVIQTSAVLDWIAAEQKAAASGN
jgi:hypothetical protein